MINLTF